jgi:hypothetical protein
MNDLLYFYFQADNIVHNVYTGNFMNFVKKQVFKAE